MTRPRLLPALIAVWLLVVLLFFHLVVEPFPAGSLLELFGQVALLALVSAAAWGWGGFALSPLRLRERAPGGGLVPAMEIGTGLGVLALGVFALAVAGGLYRGAVLALLAIGVAALFARRAAFSAKAAGSVTREAWGAADAGLVALLGLAGLLTLPAAVAPPEFYDALIYHLAVPQQYVMHHRMIPIEGNYYAHFPANMGMLYALGLLLGSPGFAQSLHWLCGALAVLVLFSVAARHLGRREALLACVLFGLNAGVMLVSTYAIVDLAVTLFATLCFAAVLEWWRDAERRWLVVAGIAAGLAMGTKYTAVLVTWFPAVVALAARPGRPLAARTRDVALVTVLAVALVVPWLARNAWFTGNPVAPYLFSAGSQTPDVLDEMQRRLPQGAGPVGLVLHVLAGPWNASMKQLGAGGYLGPVFLVLLPALPFVGRLPAVAIPAAILAGAGLASWAATTQVTRYLMPVLPMGAMLAAVAARRLPRWLAWPSVGWPLVYGVYLYTFLVLTIGAWRPVVGAETPDAYLTRRVSYYAAARFIGTLPPEARVLMVGEGRGFYMPRPYVASTPFDPPALDRFTARAPGGEQDLVALLRQEGFTHLLVSGPELRRTRELTADGLMQRFFPSGSPRLLFERQDVRVYALPD